MPNRRLDFVTGDHRGEDTVKKWQNYLEQVYFGHEVRSAHGYVVGRLTKRSFAELGISRHQASAHTICRTRSHIQTDKIEQFAIVFPTAGDFRCLQMGREICSSVGGMYILNTSEPFEVDTSECAGSYALTIPSELCRLGVTNIDSLTCRADVGDPMLIDAVRGFIGGMFEKDSLVDERWLTKILCGLVEMMLNPQYGDAEGSGWRAADAARYMLIDAIRRVIRERLGDNEFGVADAALACRVSVRHLQSVLNGFGTTFRDELTAARLQRAQDLLRSPARGRKPVGQIARECGFASQAHFSTSYRKRFGIAPRDQEIADDEDC